MAQAIGVICIISLVVFVVGTILNTAMCAHMGDFDYWWEGVGLSVAAGCLVWLAGVLLLYIGIIFALGISSLQH